MPDIASKAHGRETLNTELVDRALGWLSDSLDGLDPTQSTAIRHPLSLFSPLLEVLHLRRHLHAQGGHLSGGASARRFGADARRLAETVQPRLALQQGQARGADVFYLDWLQLETNIAIFGSAASEVTPLQRIAPNASPYSNLEYAYVQGCFRRPDNAPDRAALFLTWLTSQDYGGVVDADQCYELCHAVFYLSDFGLTRPVVPYRNTLRQLATLMLEATLSDDQLDLAAELILTVTLLGGDNATGLLDRAWSRLRQKQLPSGAIPGPLFDESEYSLRLNGGGDHDPKRYATATCYHTTIVAVLAAISTHSRSSQQTRL